MKSLVVCVKILRDCSDSGTKTETVSSGLVVNLASKTAHYAKEHTKRKVVMIQPDKNRITEARERFMKRFPIDRIRKIKKYRNLSNQQYLELINNLEKLGILLLESYIFTLNNRS